MDVIGREVPLDAPLILFEAVPEEASLTVGATPPVSNTKPAGAFRMIVPLPTAPEMASL
jgi:hypothetical protein